MTTNLKVTQSVNRVNLKVTQNGNFIKLTPTVVVKNGGGGGGGADGLSAYEIAVNNGFIGSESDWLLSLKGADGIDGTNGSDGIDGIDGTNGSDGLSAYEIAVDDGYVGDETSWLASLVGADGTDGVDGSDANVTTVNIKAAGAVITTTDQEIDGVKTFLKSPIVPTPTTDTQTANKKFVDDKNTIKETRANNTRQFWDGTQAQYDAILTKNANTYYFIIP